MAIKKSAAELMKEAKLKYEEMMAEAKEQEKKEKAKLKQEEDKAIVKIGRLVFDFQKAGFSGFQKNDFIKQINEIVAGINKVAPVTAAVTDASGSDVLDEVQADAQEAVVEADQASIDGSGSSDTSAEADAAATSTDEGSNKKKFW